MIAKERKPSHGELRWFGLVLLAVFGVFGLLVRARGGETAPIALWMVGGVLAIAYYSVPALRRPLHGAWMRLVYPLSWLVSHLLLGGIYFLVLTPLGFLMRIVGHDPLRRRPPPSDRSSYWLVQRSSDKVARYYQKF